MSEPPPALRTVDRWFAGISLGHEAISDLHADLVVRERASEATRRLLAESAEITLAELPAQTRTARRLAGAWSEQSLLDPTRAEVTLGALQREVERIGPAIRRLQQRQGQIARELRHRLDAPD